MTSMRYLNTILTVLALLLALNLWIAWSAAPPAAAHAHAQGIPDEGAQRQQMIDQLKLLNRKADRIDELLASGRLRVRVTLPDNDGN